MSSIIVTATLENGVLKPDEDLDLPPRTRVRLTVDPLNTVPETVQRAWQELERLWEESRVDSGGAKLTRDQLHERR